MKHVSTTPETLLIKSVKPAELHCVSGVSNIVKITCRKDLKRTTYLHLTSACYLYRMVVNSGMIEKNEWYKHLIVDCKAILVEGHFASSWVLIETYHKLGLRILEDADKEPITKLVKRVSVDIRRTDRTVWKSVQLATDYQRLEDLNTGKNITLRKVFNEILPEKNKHNTIPKGLKLPKTAKIIHDDFRNVKFEDKSVDLIITDPPYPSEYLPLWSDLSYFASRVLKPSSFLISYSGQIHLPEVMKRLQEHLSYYWTFCLYHVGGTQLIIPRNITCRWKPILIYQKPPFKKLEFVIQDYVISEAREKEGHEWQQSESGVAKLIETFSKAGDRIVDPFSGAGTFTLIAHKMNRIATGIEINEDTYKSSLVRMYEQVGKNK